MGWVQLNGSSPQEQREHYADAELAADTKDAAGVLEAKATWMEKARCWLKRKKQLDDTAEAKRPKKFRKKSYMWLLSLNTTLVNVIGRSIEAYCHDEDGDGPSGVSPPAAMWPYLAISADQGPDGLCASFFLAYHCKANIEFFWDPSHGYQRDIMLATGMVGLSAFMHLMVITYNLGHGPWDSHARYAQLCESTTSYLQHHAHQCPLFHFYKMQIAKEFGLLEFSGQALADADIIQAMKDHWSMKQKGAKVHLCRFGDFTTKAAEFDGHHTFTLLRCLHLGLTEGMFSKAVLDILLKPVKLDAPSETAEKTPVARSNDAHQKLRHLCNNNIAVAAVMLSDYRTGFRTKVLYKLADPVCRWYKHQSSNIRSTAEAASWLAQQVKGDIWIPLQATWKQLLDQQLLEQLGLDITFFPGVHQLDEGHPVVGENEEIADLAGRYIISLVALRDRRLQFYTEGWQGKQTMLFSGDPAVQSQAVRDLQEQHLAFKALKLRTDSVSRNMVRRSIFQLAPMQQLVSLCAESGWAPSEQLAQHCKNRVSSVLQSKCAEDIINKGRSLERPAPNQSQLPARRVWKNLIDEGVVDKLYRYKEPQWRDVAMPRGEAGRLPEAVFKQSFNDPPKKIKAIVGKSSKPPWFSAGPTTMHLAYADLHVMTELHSTGKWESLATFYFSTLAAGRDIALRHRGSGQWYFGLPVSCPIAGRGWPADVAMEGGRVTHLRPCLESRPQWLVISDPDAWEALTYCWQSPLQQKLALTKAGHPVSSELGICALARSQPTKLISEGASQAFWDIPKAALVWFGKYYGLEVSTSNSLMQLLKALVLHILPKTTDARLAGILSLRLRNFDIHDDILASDECSDLIHDKDRQVYEKARQDMDAHEVERSTYLNELVALKRAKGKKAKAPTIKSANGRPFPSSFPGGSLTSEEACLYIPEGTRIYRDDVNGRWQCTHSLYGRRLTRSFAYMLHGFEHACKLCIQTCWLEVCQFHGIEPDTCPVQNLFAPGGETGSKPKGSQPSSSASRDG